MRKLNTLLFALLATQLSAQTSVQNFGVGTGSQAAGTSTAFIPNPSSGTSYINVGNGASANLNNPGLSSLGTTTELKATASSSVTSLLAQHDFESTLGTPTLSITTGTPVFLSGSSGGGDRPATSPYYSGGARGWGVTNGTNTLTFANTSLTGYSNAYLEFNLASFSIGATNNGADVGDIVTVEISTDGGTIWSSELTVAGNSNAYWSYTSGTGTATTTYDGNGTPTAFSPAAGGARTTDGYSTVHIDFPSTLTQVRVRITMLNNSANERWAADDIQVYGTASVTKLTPVLTYTAGKSFYTTFSALFGDNAGSTTATSGTWSFYQGLNTSSTFNNNLDYVQTDVFTGLRWTYGASGSLTLDYLTGASTWTSIPGCWTQGTVYKVEIVGNNNTTTSNYTYGTAQTVAANKYDLYINGNKVGDDLAKDGVANNTALSAITFIGQSSTGNVANIFVDDISIYNSIPATITTSCSAPTTNSSALSFSGTTSTQTTLTWTNGNGGNRIVVVRQNSLIAGAPTNGTTYTASSVYGSGGTIATNEYVVYNGCSNSVTVTGLTAGGGYDFKVFDYNCNSGNETYATGSSNSTVVTTPNTPGSFATDCGTPGDITLSWTAPSGFYNNVLIFARVGSAPAHTPSGSGASYTGANLNYTSATTYGGTDKLVYSGTGTSAVITGLTAGQTYYFRAYTYSGSVYSTVTSTVNQISGVPNATSPAAATASGQLNVTWTNPTGSCWDEVLILATNNASVTQTPTGDGTSYTQNAFYGTDVSEIVSLTNEYIVYQGTGTSLSVYGLTNGINYKFKIFTRKGTTWSSGVTFNGTPNNVAGDYQSHQTGNWNTLSTWEYYNGTTWVIPSTTIPNMPIGSALSNSVTIRNGHTVTFNTASTFVVGTLIINTGGKLYSNSTTTIYPLDIYEQVTNNGIIGNGATTDGIAFNAEGASVYIGGSGTTKLSALKKEQNNNFTSNVTIDADIDFNIIGANRTVMYCNQNFTAFNVTISSGVTVSTPASTGNVGLVTTGATGFIKSAAYTVYGTLNVNGILSMSNASSIFTGYTLTIKNGGKIYVDSIDASASGFFATFGLTIESGGWLDIYGKAFYNFSTTNNTFTCNTGSLVEYCGSVAQSVESGITYDNLKYSGGANNKTSNGSLTVNGDMTVDAAIFVMPASANNLNLGDDLILQNGGTMQDNNKLYLTINCNDATTAEVFNGNGQMIKCVTLNSTKTSGGISMTGTSGNTDMYVGNQFKIVYTSTAVFADGGNTISVGDDALLGTAASTSANFTLTGTLKFIGAVNSPTTTDHKISNTAGTGITNAHLYNVVLEGVSGSNLPTLEIYPTAGGATLYIDGSLTIKNLNSVNTVFDPNNNTIDINGGWTTYGATGFTEGTGQVIMNGTSLQAISGAETFYNLQLNNSAGASIANNTIVSNVLTLTSGVIATSSNELQVTNNAIASVVYTSGWVNGNLRRTLSTTNNLVYDFPVGGSTYLQLATLKFTNTTGLGATPTVLAFFTSGSPAVGPSSSSCFINASPVTGMLNGGYWTVTPSAYTNGTTTYDITLTEKGYSNFSGNASQLGVIKRHDNTFAWAGTNLTGGTGATEGFHSNANSSIVSSVATVERTGVKSFSEFGVGYGANTLPVELTSFIASANENSSVDLAWETEAEINCNYFSVERSADGINFSSIGKVTGNGTSQIAHNYSLIDNSPLCGTNYYRLNQVDLDGANHYSEIRSAEITCNNVSVYPNPVLDVLHINLATEGKTLITVLSLDGRIILQQDLNMNSTSFNLNLTQLVAGNYFISINQNGVIRTERFTKQ